MATLEEVFSRDPNDWTDTEIGEIVAGLRAQRKNFMAQEQLEKQKTKAPRATSAGAAKAPKATPTIDPKKLTLENLGIQLSFGPTKLGG